MANVVKGTGVRSAVLAYFKTLPQSALRLRKP